HQQAPGPGHVEGHQAQDEVLGGEEPHRAEGGQGGPDEEEPADVAHVRPPRPRAAADGSWEEDRTASATAAREAPMDTARTVSRTTMTVPDAVGASSSQPPPRSGPATATARKASGPATTSHAVPRPRGAGPGRPARRS